MVTVLSIGLESLKKKVKEKKFVNIQTLIIVGVIIVSIPSMLWSLTLHGIGIGVEDNADRAIRFFNKNDLKGPIYNNYNIGNYVEYRLYPSEKVFVDGRPEGYPKEFFEKEYYPAETPTSLRVLSFNFSIF